MRVFTCLAVLCCSAPAFAGDVENFMPCSKSTECKSKQCFQKKCSPSQWWNGFGKEGSHCEGPGNCASRVCDHHRCAPKLEEVKKTATKGPRSPTQPSGVGTRAPEPEPVRETLPPIALDACGIDLRATVYLDDLGGELARENDQLAADDCARFSAETIARARALIAAKYGIGFSETCREVEGKSDAEIACGRKYFDTLSEEDRDGPFKIPVSCSGKQGAAVVARCVKDLGAVKVAGRTAKKVCTTYDAETIARARRLTAGGYDGDFAKLCGSVDHRSDAEIACAKKELDALYPDDPHGYEFSVSSECMEPIKPR